MLLTRDTSHDWMAPYVPEPWPLGMGSLAVLQIPVPLFQSASMTGQNLVSGLSGNAYAAVPPEAHSPMQ
mgnify:FL=1